jgi:group I intron endonuclease
MITGIYKITSPNGHIYIGRAFDINKRWKKYRLLDCKSQCFLYNCFLKYGVDNHKFGIIETIDGKLNKFEINTKLNELEYYYISFFNSFYDNNKLGLNLTKGGDCRERSKESNLKQSKSMIGRKLSDEHKLKISQKSKGMNHSLETKMILRDKNLGKKHSLETIKKQIESHLGKKHTDTHKDNIRKAMIGRKHSDVAKKKMSNSAIGRKKSETHKNNIRLANLGKKRSIEKREELTTVFK